jgi:hypothetical protein
MRLRNAGRVIATTTVAIFAAASMGGAFATSIQENFGSCMENTGQEPPGDLADRIRCCKDSGGAWVEIYDADGNVVDAFCDGAEEVYEPEEVRPTRTVNPAVLDGAISATPISVASEPTPAPASVSAEPADAASIERAASDPAPAPADEPAPKKIKRKHHHRRHR